MAEFKPGPDGSPDDRVRLVLNGTDTRIFQTYVVRCSMFQQPAIFEVTLGHSRELAELQRLYPPNTPFQLFVGDYPQFTGFTDGYVSESDGDGGTFTIRGRDVLARLLDCDVQSDRTFTNVTYVQLVRTAMEECGLGDRLLIADNEANAEIRGGVGVTHTPTAASAATPKATPPPKPITPLPTPSSPDPATDAGLRGLLGGAEGVARTLGVAGAGAKRGGSLDSFTITAKLGTRWLQFLQEYLEKAGLFLWADFEGNIVLSAPNGQQSPTYHFVRKRGQDRNAGNVVGARFLNDTRTRFSFVQVFARGNGKKKGRGKLNNAFIDDEMVAFGFNRARTFRDAHCLSEAQAEKYARHKIAEGNRAGWNLTYTVKGHFALTVDGERAVLCPDMVAQVDDDEFDIHRELYVEAVEFRASPKTTTTVTMMRPEDLVFEKDPDVVAEIEAQLGGKRKRKRKRGRKKR